jgi:hypothetical protein
MPEAKLIVLYPFPEDIEKFTDDYENHIKLLHEKLHLPDASPPYTITRFIETPLGKPAYYQMFVFSFPSIDAMQQGMTDPAFAVIGEDANRISTGGAPIFLFGA